MDLERRFYGALPAILKSNDSDLTATHFISTEHLDRHQQVMVAAGAKVPPNGVRVFWQHGYDMLRDYKPIGKPLAIAPDTFKGVAGVVAQTQFYQPSIPQAVDGFPALCYDWVKQGILDGWSIGFMRRQTEERPVKLEDGQEVSIPFITDWELLEYSLVGVPANPYAMGKALDDAVKSGRLTKDVLKHWTGLCVGCGSCHDKERPTDPPQDAKEQATQPDISSDDLLRGVHAALTKKQTP